MENRVNSLDFSLTAKRAKNAKKIFLIFALLAFFAVSDCPSHAETLGW